MSITPKTLTFLHMSSSLMFVIFLVFCAESFPIPTILYPSYKMGYTHMSIHVALLTKVLYKLSMILDSL